jgi:TolB-like protein
MSEVFVSYARSTAQLAQTLVAALRERGFSVWIDDDLPAHRAYSPVIEEQLTAAKAAVVIWSSDAVKSEWVLSEANRARQDHKLIQVTTDTAGLPMPFDTIQCADLANWTGDLQAPGWRKVLASVSHLARGEAASRPPKPPARAAAKTQPLLAVLAFDNLSGDADMAYFSDGMSEEILNTVSRGADMKVIGRASSFQFRGADKAAANVAEHLQATHVLDGSVQRSGARVRISSHLVECAGQTTLWSNRFDRDLTDIFALQDEIAAAVAAALKVVFAPSGPAQSIDPAIYDIYLRVQAYQGTASPEKSEQAIRLLELVVAAAPKFARAWGRLAAELAFSLRRDGGEAPSFQQARNAVIKAANTALELDPAVASAYQGLIWLLPFGFYQEREALHNRALQAAPNDPEVLTLKAWSCSQVGRLREALEYASRAYDLDPLHPWVANAYAMFVPSYDLSRDLWQTFRTRWPDNDAIAFNGVGIAAANGDWERFEQLVDDSRLRLQEPVFRGLVWYARNLRHPDPHAVMHALDRAREQVSRTGTVQLDRLTSLYRLGQREEVFALIGQASFAHMFDEAGPPPSGMLSADLIFRAGNADMMADIRFVGLCAKLGLCDYWVKSGAWPDCAEQVPYDFKAEARRLATA